MPIPISVALTADSLPFSSSTGDGCHFEAPSIMNPCWMLDHAHFQEPAYTNYGNADNSDNDLVRLQATIFQGFEEDTKRGRLFDFPEDTASIDLDPLLAAAEMMDIAFSEFTPVATTIYDCANTALASHLDASTSTHVLLPQEHHSQQPACYSFLAPVRRSSFQDQESPRKRGRPVLIRMDALPGRRVACSPPSNPCSLRTGSNSCVSDIHSIRLGDHLQGTASWSTIPNAPIPTLTPTPLSMPAPAAMIASTFTLDSPLNFSTLPYSYSPCLPQPDLSASSSPLPPRPVPPFPVWSSLCSSLATPSLSLASYENTSYSSPSSPFSLTISTDSFLSVQPHIQMSSSSSQSSSSSAKSKTSPSSSSSPTEFFIMHPYQHSDKKVDRRSFNSRKELKQAQAQAAHAHALAQSQCRSPAL